MTAPSGENAAVQPLPNYQQELLNGAERYRGSDQGSQAAEVARIHADAAIDPRVLALYSYFRGHPDAFPTVLGQVYAEHGYTSKLADAPPKEPKALPPAAAAGVVARATAKLRRSS